MAANNVQIQMIEDICSMSEKIDFKKLVKLLLSILYPLICSSNSN